MPNAPGSGLPPDVTGTVITVGTFDGVHRGHQDVLRRLTALSRVLGAPSLLVTFDPHPLEVVNPSAAPQLLTVGDEKLEVLAESEVDYVAVIPFTRELASWSADRFVDEVLIGHYRVSHLLMGHDHGFGRNRAGDPEVLQRLGAQRGFAVDVVEPVLARGNAVSSSAIRRAVAGGDLARAAEGLGRPYAIGGTVVRGEARGRLLGYPTANIALAGGRKLLPPTGVYAAKVQTPAGAFDSMINLGPRPTVGDSKTSLEAHLFGAVGDLYGCRVRVDLIQRLRDTRRFDSLDLLRDQLRRDEREARHALSAFGSDRGSVD
jgi:riboflavin kinase/FMN adenylyltransferase